MLGENHKKVPDLRNTRVVCRTGSALVSGDLDVVNHRDARSVILLGQDGELDPDADVVMAILALRREEHDIRPGRHIVAEIRDANVGHAARLAGGWSVSRSPRSPSWRWSARAALVTVHHRDRREKRFRSPGPWVECFWTGCLRWSS